MIQNFNLYVDKKRRGFIYNGVIKVDRAIRKLKYELSNCDFLQKWKMEKKALYKNKNRIFKKEINGFFFN